MNFSRSKIFLICCFVFIVGIATASFLPIKYAQNDLWWFAGMAGCGVAIILFWNRKNEGVPVRPGRLHLFVIFALFLFLGLWRYAIALPANTPDKIWYYNGQTVTVVGVVSSEPDIRVRSKKLEVRSKKLRMPQGLQPPRGDWNFVSGKILVTTNLYPSYNYGDELEIICKLQAPEKFSGFDYDRYLARYDIYSVCYYPKIELLGRGGGNLLYKKIFNYKNKLRGIINYGLSEPEASLGRAIILGDKKGIPDDLREKFSQAGISHIVAISGMHISILAVVLMGILLAIGLPRKKAFWLAGLFLLFYIMLIGLPASAMRAGLMGFLVLWAMNLGRLNKLTNSLVLAAAILLLINPRLLRDDIGFQLSFLAVMGIVYCYPILNNWYSNVIASPVVHGINSAEQSQESDKLTKKPRLLRSLQSLAMTKKAKVIFDILAITIAAQIFTLPIIALNFSQVSIVSPISNLLVLWTLPVLMIASLAAIGLSLVFPNFAFVFFLPAWLLLKYIIIVAEWLTKLPYAYVGIDYLWWGWVIVYYGVAGWAVYKIKKSVKD